MKKEDLSEILFTKWIKDQLEPKFKLYRYKPEISKEDFDEWKERFVKEGLTKEEEEKAIKKNKDFRGE